ncbi:ABC transporter permease [Candidatus Dependentiae bacterium]|jgi:lipoprotein-releasing system permease protein|nr:ABC transporter permease [Candidatus Dependentiae bacterium]
MPSIQNLLVFQYLFAQEKDSNISFMTKICFLGISIGTFALMLTLIITNGFEKVIHEKMQGINAQIIISSPGNQLNYTDIQKTLLHEYPDLLAGISGTTLKQVIIDHNKQQTVLLVKGIDPEQESSVTSLREKIIQTATQSIILDKTTSPALAQVLRENSILIGYKMAQEHRLKVGQSIDVLIPEPTGKRRIALSKKKVIIGGIFKVGLEEYDNNLAFASLSWLGKTFDEQGVDAITIKLKTNEQTIWSKIKNIFLPINHEQQAIQELKTRLPHLTINSWKDLYPALVSSLKLEKYVMFFILALITLVASMNMISLLFMQIQQKQRDIAILKVMGLSQRKIRGIFLRLGLLITLLASTCGLLLAFIAGYILEHYPYIELPDVYYVSYLPARIDGEIFIVVFIATMLLGFCATWFPAQRAQRINIAQVLRHQ